MDPFSRHVLNVDTAVEVERAGRGIRAIVARRLRKRGAVVGISGGVDSSVVAALCVNALGKDRVFGLLMPERDSSEETRQLSRALVEHLGIEWVEEDITEILTSAGCYRRRDDAIREVVPEFKSEWRSKIVLPSVLDSDQYRVFSVVVQAPGAAPRQVRLNKRAYLALVASTNFKQRTRKMLEYFHADRLNYGVAGTPNRLEYDQGFFVKNGDGAADFKPIAHLYKAQVYALARELGLPDAICDRAPTTDTYSMPQSQEEFFFSLPHEEMDLCLFARDNGVSATETAGVLGLQPEQVERVFRDIDGKRTAAEYLHMPALTIDEAP
jgi:NAD+ synthase